MEFADCHYSLPSELKYPNIFEKFNSKNKFINRKFTTLSCAVCMLNLDKDSVR